MPILGLRGWGAALPTPAFHGDGARGAIAGAPRHRLEDKDNSMDRPFKGLLRPFKGLRRLLKALIRPLRGLIRPLKALIRPLKALIRPLKALT